MDVHDTVHVNLEGGASQQGHLILAVHASNTNFRVPVSLVSWHIKKIKRIVRRSLAAETCSMSTCQEHLDWMRTMWEQMTRGEFVLENYEQFSRRVPAFFLPTAKVCTTQYTKEQLQRHQTREWQLSWPKCGELLQKRTYWTNANMSERFVTVLLTTQNCGYERMTRWRRWVVGKENLEECESGCAYHGTTDFVTNTLMKVQHVTVSQLGYHVR